MDKPLTLASLFDGSGGFPLGGLLCGIEPVWAAEVEPFPIRVTTKRLPQVKHYGDVCKIKGADVPPTDIVTFGSPCQSFSFASGNRKGLKGKSGLFYEAVRIIREMREATGNKQPRFAVMENVYGIFSSQTNGKSDFLEVLNELVKTKDPALSVPLPETGKWSTAGEIVGDGFSLSWRTFNTQFWGIPHCRQRCYIVLDFDSERAGEILFNESRLRENPPWHKEESTAVISGRAESQITIKSPVIAFEPGQLMRLGKKPFVDRIGCLCAAARDNLFSVAYQTSDNEYVVRRIMPREAAMLQGFPSDYCSGLETPKPSLDNIKYWWMVWETHRRIMGESSTPKSRKQLIKWLRNPHSDAAEYKMWGNGVSLPIVVFVLGGIVHFS